MGFNSGFKGLISSSYSALTSQNLVVTVRTTRFNTEKFYVLFTESIYVFLWFSEQTAFIFLYIL